MARQHRPFFLDEWLRNIVSSGKDSHVTSSSTSAPAIIQAWADLRDSLQRQSFDSRHLQALGILVHSQASIHVADPQAKLLLAILSSQNISLLPESYPLFLRLLYIWLRKSRQSSQLVDSAIEIVLLLFSQKLHHESSLLLSEGILLLGALSFQTSASEKSIRLCQELLCKMLEEGYMFIFLSDELASSALAGIGYTLSSTGSIYFGRILDMLLSAWGQEGGPSGTISQGLMLLHLVEWAFSNSLQFRSLDKIDLVKASLENIKPSHSSFAVVMAAAGVLRSINRSGLSGFINLKDTAEKRIDIVAEYLLSKTNGFQYDGNSPMLNLLLNCIALALARCGSVAYRSYVFMCLALALVTEIFPLQNVYYKVLNLPKENWPVILEKIDKHLSSVIFKEAGSITGLFCNQYASASEDDRDAVQNQIWDYCQQIYMWHRQASIVLLGRGDNLIRTIEKIAESTFLMVVVFAQCVTKYRLNSRANRDTQLQASVRILVSFSCMEYFRRMRVPEYMDTIRAVIVSLQENESACISFIESMPSYDDLTKNSGFSNMPKLEYQWSIDEVQTARIIFYMRVIPTCVERLPAPVFKKVVPTMFLYLGHPNAKVSRYAHSMFVAFMSSGKDSSQDERVLLKEQLVFYYLKRSLEGYPWITPFEGVASGVAALVRHLPAGSPSIFYCFDCLVEKAGSLVSSVNNDSDMWKNWEGELEPSKKLLDLLLRLLSITDIQVLPSLMKSLAQLFVDLPVNGQNMLLNQLYEQIAESDDVTRKPALISWLQSLSYLCSQGAKKKEAALVGEMGSDRTMPSISSRSMISHL